MRILIVVAIAFLPVVGFSQCRILGGSIDSAKLIIPSIEKQMDANLKEEKVSNMRTMWIDTFKKIKLVIDTESEKVLSVTIIAPLSSAKEYFEQLKRDAVSCNKNNTAFKQSIKTDNYNAFLQTTATSGKITFSRF